MKKNYANVISNMREREHEKNSIEISFNDFMSIENAFADDMETESPFSHPVEFQ